MEICELFYEVLIEAYSEAIELLWKQNLIIAEIYPHKKIAEIYADVYGVIKMQQMWIIYKQRAFSVNASWKNKKKIVTYVNDAT